MVAKLVRRKQASPRRHAVASIRPVELTNDVCLELHDHSVFTRSAVEFFGLRNSRDPYSQAAKFAEQFEAQNRLLFSLLDISLDRVFDGNDFSLSLTSGSMVGALPLMSPTRATPDYGIVVQPRFEWAGIGPMLAEMGWRIAPEPLKLPLLKRSERRVPPWVISFMVLNRLKALLDSLVRRFEIVNAVRRAPRGTINWSGYLTQQATRGNFLSVPCTYPDLRDDVLLKGAIRYSLERHLRSLQSQKEQGAYVHRLIEFAELLLRTVHLVPVHVPSPKTMVSWMERPMRSEHFIEGLQAIQWTVEDRGLAGTSDLEGLPWTMSMDAFFEAWVETVLQSVARNTGATLRVGRKRETTCPIRWNPAFLGSQKSLVPDLWLEWESTTLIVDAKYKRHFEELQRKSWNTLETHLREEHRNDLLQVLAYGNLARTPRVIACLAFACSPENWKSLLERKRLFHKAQINVGSRDLHLWLTAIPMATNQDEISRAMEREIRQVITATA